MEATETHSRQASLRASVSGEIRTRMNTIDFTFCLAALLSFVASVALWFLVDQLSGIFVGLWVPSILALWCGIRSMISFQP